MIAYLIPILLTSTYVVHNFKYSSEKLDRLYENIGTNETRSHNALDQLEGVLTILSLTFIKILEVQMKSTFNEWSNEENIIAVAVGE